MSTHHWWMATMSVILSGWIIGLLWAYFSDPAAETDESLGDRDGSERSV